MLPPPPPPAFLFPRRHIHEATGYPDVAAKRDPLKRRPAGNSAAARWPPPTSLKPRRRPMEAARRARSSLSPKPIGEHPRRSPRRPNGRRKLASGGGACPAGPLPNQDHCLWWVPAPAAAAGVGGAASTVRRPPPPGPRDPPDRTPQPGERGARRGRGLDGD